MTTIVNGVELSIEDTLPRPTREESMAEIMVVCPPEFSCGVAEIITTGATHVVDGHQITVLASGSNSAVIEVDGVPEIITRGSSQPFKSILIIFTEKWSK